MIKLPPIQDINKPTRLNMKVMRRWIEILPLVGVQISNGLFVWLPPHSQFGPSADSTLFYHYKIYENLEKDEKIIGDGKYVTLPGCLYHTPTNTSAIHSARVIIENTFARLKQFQCLTLHWRHGIEKHAAAFIVCAQITNIKIYFKPLRAK